MQSVQLNSQDLHQLAMSEVGNFLQEDNFEFLAVNSKPKKHPQFICTKEKQLYFVVVKGCLYPDNPKKYNVQRMDKLKAHAIAKEAILLFAGVGFANAEDYERPLTKNDTYVVNFEGLQTMV